jgi:hypothetical protein
MAGIDLRSGSADGSHRRVSRARDVNTWIDFETVLDSWRDLRRERLITLYPLAEPLRDQGYVAVCQSKQTGGRSVVFLRDHDELRSLDPGTEVAQLRRRARAAGRGRRRWTASSTGST